jgi:creatinine amidohydrolase
MPELRAAGVRGVAPNGVLGDPREASAAEGAALLEAITAEAWARLRSGRVDARGCAVRDGDGGGHDGDGGTRGDSAASDPITGAVS